MSTDEQFICEICQKHYPVPSLARDCEDQHLED